MVYGIWYTSSPTQYYFVIPTVPPPPQPNYLLFMSCTEVSEQRSTLCDVFGGPAPYANSTPYPTAPPPPPPILQASQGVGGRGDRGHWTATALIIWSVD